MWLHQILGLCLLALITSAQAHVPILESPNGNNELSLMGEVPGIKGQVSQIGEDVLDTAFGHQMFNPSNPSEMSNSVRDYGVAPDASARDLQTCDRQFYTDLKEHVRYSRTCSLEMNTTIRTLDVLLLPKTGIIDRVDRWLYRIDLLFYVVGNFTFIADKLKPLVSKIPYVGPFIPRVIKQMDDVVVELKKIQDKASSTIRNIFKALQKARSFYAKVEVYARRSYEYSFELDKVLVWAAFWDRNCPTCLGNSLRTLTPGLRPNRDFMKSCTEFPLLPGITAFLQLGPIDRLISAIEGMVTWVIDLLDRFLDDVGKRAQQVWCCNRILAPLRIGSNVLTEVFNVATCATAGLDPLGDLISDLINTVTGNLLNNIVNRLTNALIGEINRQLGSIPVLDITIPEVRARFSGCSVNLVKRNNLRELLQFRPLAQDNTISIASSISNVGTAVAEACSEAWDDLTDSSDWECCSAYRICGENHQIVFYEDSNCEEDSRISGTISHTDYQPKSFPRTACLAQREARSIRIQGRIPRGTGMVISDKIDRHYGGDSLRMYFTRELPEGRSICHRIGRSNSASTYLNTWVSTFHSGTILPNRVSVFRNKPREFYTPVQNGAWDGLAYRYHFYRERNCADLKRSSGDYWTAAGSKTIGSNYENMPNALKHDGEKSLTNSNWNKIVGSIAITGPAPKGLSLILGQNKDDFCIGSSATMYLTRALKANEDVCVNILGVTGIVRNTPVTYRYNHNRGQSLDRDVQRFRVIRVTNENAVNGIWETQPNPGGIRNCEAWNRARKGAYCENNNECLSLKCYERGNKCVEGTQGENCDRDDDCASGHTCTSDRRCTRGTAGSPCQFTSDCTSNFYCNSRDQCTLKRGTGASCTVITRDECRSGGCNRRTKKCT